MNKDQIAELREHYDNNSTSDDMEGGTWETETATDPMVTTSFRLPKSQLDWLRDQAAQAGVKPTALIRQWIEEHRRVAEGLGSAAGSDMYASALVMSGQWAVDGLAPGVLAVSLRQVAANITESLDAQLRLLQNVTNRVTELEHSILEHGEHSHQPGDGAAGPARARTA